MMCGHLHFTQSMRYVEIPKYILFYILFTLEI